MPSDVIKSVVKSKDAEIEVVSRNSTGTAGKRFLVSVDCGGAESALAKVSNPVLGMQLRGYGASESRAADTQKAVLADYVGDIDAVVDSAPTPQPILLGYSHAGFFTTAYAIAHPAKIAGLILVEPALFNTTEELRARVRLAEQGQDGESLRAMLKHVQPEIADDPELLRPAVDGILANINSPQTLANELRVRADNPISEDLLSKLSMPVLLIGGQLSHVSNIVTRFHRILPTSYLWWIKGATHTDLLSAKFGGQLEAVIRNFMAGIN